MSEPEIPPDQVPIHYPGGDNPASVRPGLTAPEPEAIEVIPEIPPDLHQLLVRIRHHKRNFRMQDPPGPDLKDDAEYWKRLLKVVYGDRPELRDFFISEIDLALGHHQ